MLPHVQAITDEDRVSTSALRTPIQGGLGVPRLQMILAPALRSSIDSMLARCLWHMTEVNRCSPMRASSVGSPVLNIGRRCACLHQSQACMHPALNADGVCSPPGLGRTSNLRVTEAKTIDPLRRASVALIMTFTIPATKTGEAQDNIVHLLPYTSR